MKIDTYYRLPNGRKGMYVGINRDGMNAFSAHDDHGFLYHHYSHPAQDYAEYREPRVFEDEIFLLRFENGEIETHLYSGVGEDHNGTIIARRKITIEEGEGL